MLFFSMFKKRYTCWICLEQDSPDPWISHECGCNLQVHKKCLIQWLLAINKKQLDNYSIDDFYKINTVKELRRRVLYLVDSHRGFQEEVGIVETIQSLPAVGQTWASFICVADLALRATFHMPPPEYHNHDMWRGLPIEQIDCPQCKRKIMKGELKYHSKSPTLLLLHIFRRFTRYLSTVSVILFSATNTVKWWFRLGLWQLRCLFPESVLRRTLKVSTTKALDVYSATMSGIDSISNENKILILGFPLHLLSLGYKDNSLWFFRLLYPMLIIARHQNSKLLVKAFTLRGLVVMSCNWIYSWIFERMYRHWLSTTMPYFYEPRTSNWTNILEPAQGLEEKDYSNVIIQTTWSDSFVQTLIWPWLGQQLSRRVLSRSNWLTQWLISQDKHASPDECQFVLNLIGCGLVVLGKDLFKLYATYCRIKELKALGELLE